MRPMFLPRIDIRTVVAAMTLFYVFFFGISTARAQDATKVEPTNQEIISEVARQTGLATDMLDKVMQESPKLFGDVKDTITAVKIVDLLFSAEDTEVLAEFVNREIGNYIDGYIKKFYPASFLSFYSAVKLYKDSLEAVRDYVFIPSLEAAIYERYKGHRGGVADYRYAGVSEAYEAATATGGKYFPAKKKMYDELVKAKGYNPKHIGEKLENSLWKEIDAFWMNRLELQYQQELARTEKEQIIAAAWQKSAASLKMIEAAVQKMQGEKVDLESFFLKIPDDLPEGWWFAPYKRWTSSRAKPMNKSGKVWKQHFFISRESGFVKEGKRWHDPKDKSRYFRPTNLDIRIMATEEETARTSYASSVKNSGFQYMGKNKLAVIKTERRESSTTVHVQFFKNGYKVTMRLGGHNGLASTPDAALGEYFARIVASRIN